MKTETININRVNNGKITESSDLVVVEEPMEILLTYSSTTGRMQRNIAVIMRTPGNDTELAAGFLFTEGIIQSKEAIEKINHFSADENRVMVNLKEGIIPVLNNIERNFYSTSSCGICGKSSIDAIRTNTLYQYEATNISVRASLLYLLQEKLSGEQEVFRDTGGIHASALFKANGELMMVREDVGRHNALDKLIGASLMNGNLPLNHYILLLSGRASFELIQKASMAGIQMVAAVGAPSSLAVEMAKEAGITLIGFLRNDRFNIYTGEKRIII